MTALCISAHAIGLGGIVLQSNLGQNLRATVALIGLEDDDAALHSCVKARLHTPDGIPLSAPAISVGHDSHGKMLQLSGSQKLYEPALTLVIELSCEGKSQREYTILLDPLEWPAAPLKTPLSEAPPPLRSLPIRHAGRQPAPDDAMTKAGARAPASALSKTRPPAAAAKVRPQAPAAQAALAPKPPAAPMHNVLRLSTDDVAAVASNGTAGQKANQAANREAAPAGDTEQKLRNVQAKLMALDADASGLTPPLRPEASAGLPLAQQLDQTEQKIKEVRAKILALQVETKNMSSKEPAVIPAVKAKPVPAIATAAPPPPSSDNWLLIGLGGLLAASIAVIIAMMLRMRQLGKYTEHLGPY